MRPEFWKRSGINPDWCVSDRGRVRGVRNFVLLTIRWDDWMKTYAVFSTRGQSYIPVRQLYAEAWGDPGPNWVPDLSRGRRVRSGRAVRCLETGELFSSIQDASRCLGIPASTIGSWVRGDRTSTGHIHVEEYAK